MTYLHITKKHCGYTCVLPWKEASLHLGIVREGVVSDRDLLRFILGRTPDLQETRGFRL